MCYMDFIKILSDISIILASFVAIYGITAWKREFVGKRRIELAEDTLVLFYEAQDVIRVVRSPLGFGGEGTTRKPQEDETPTQKSARDSAYVVFERFEPHQELFSKLHAMRYRFMAQIGREAANPFDDLRKIRLEIFSAARRLSRLWAEDVSSLLDEQQSQHFEKREKYEAIFWDTFDENDPINPRLDKVISDIENICRPIIMEKGKTVSWLKRLWSKRCKNSKTTSKTSEGI